MDSLKYSLPLLYGSNNFTRTATRGENNLHSIWPSDFISKLSYLISFVCVGNSHPGSCKYVQDVYCSEASKNTPLLHLQQMRSENGPSLSYPFPINPSTFFYKANNSMISTGNWNVVNTINGLVNVFITWLPFNQILSHFFLLCFVSYFNQINAKNQTFLFNHWVFELENRN